jgi:hypothetical protein
MLLYYLHHLNQDSHHEMDVLSRVLSNRQASFGDEMPLETREHVSRPIQMLLGGYSFGSLILARVPPIASIVHTFESAEHGTAGAEIFLRARTLARQTQRTLQEPHVPSTPRSRKHKASNSHSASSPITVGGEETDPSERRRSKDSRRSASVSVVREMPHRIKTHIRRHSGSNQHQQNTSGDSQYSSSSPHTAPQVEVRYLLVSPVLIPLSTVLLPPGLTFNKAHSTDGDAGVLSLKHPTFLAFGDSDHFTSARKLRQWAERLAGDSMGRLKWIQITSAGHFWREDGASAQLAHELISWLRSDLTVVEGRHC